MAKKSEMWFGAQFSPSQVDLAVLLQVIHDNAGDHEKVTEATRDAFFMKRAGGLELAKKTMLGLRAFDLLEDDGATPTVLANDLLIAERYETYQRLSDHLSVRPLSLIIASLTSSSFPIKGMALELLAMRLTHHLQLVSRGWLLTSSDSKAAEVGLLADAKYPVFDRWLIQCCNRRWVDMDDIATAVGRAAPFKPGLILSATVGQFTERAYHYVVATMSLTNLRMILIDGRDLRAIGDDDNAMEYILHRESERAADAKKQRPALQSVVV